MATTAAVTFARSAGHARCWNVLYRPMDRAWARYLKGGCDYPCSGTVKAQSALEYLMTYGWAIVVVAVVLSAIYVSAFGNVLNGINSTCAFSTDFGCTTPTIAQNGLLQVTLVQSTPYPDKHNCGGMQRERHNPGHGAVYGREPDPPGNRLFGEPGGLLQRGRRRPLLREVRQHLQGAACG